MKTIIRKNTNKNGIEIKFDDIPSNNTISKLKKFGFRWSRMNHLWYAKYSDSLWEQVNKEFSETIDDEKKEPEPEKKNQILATETALSISKVKFKDFDNDPLKFCNNENVIYLKKNGIPYTYNSKTKDFYYLPPKRKRPDYFKTFNIHDEAISIVLKSGYKVDFDVYYSNPLLSSHYNRNYESFNYLLTQYPQQKEAPNYEKWKDFYEKQHKEHEIEVEKWHNWKIKNLSKGQKVWLLNEKNTFEEWAIDNPNNIESSYSNQREDVLRLQQQIGTIIFTSVYPLERIFIKKNDEFIPIKDFYSNESEKKLKLTDIPETVLNFIPKFQIESIIGSTEHFDIVERLEKEINDIPNTYQQEKFFNNLRKKNKDYNDCVIVYAHFFHGASDWFVLEYDRKEKLLFGYVILNGDYEMSELGYFSLKELQQNKIEFDFFWNKKTLSQALYEVNDKYFKKPI